MTATQERPNPSASLLERKRLLDSLWLAHLALVMGALMLPWWLGIADLPFPALARDTVIFGLGFGLLAWAADQIERPAPLLACIYALHSGGILFLAYLWASAGGVGNPGLLAAFSIGAVTSGLVMVRWLPFQYALLSVVSVWGIAVAQSTELQWYLVRLGMPPDLVSGLSKLPVPELQRPFVASIPTPQFQVTLLVLFTGVEIA